MFSVYFSTVADVPFANVLSYTSVRILPSAAVVWAWNNSVLATLPPHRPIAAYSVQIVPINKKRIQSAWPRLLRCYRLSACSHWTYLLWIHSNYNTNCLYHFENPAIVAIKSDICQINKSDSWLQFEKNEKNPPEGADMQKIKNKS